jgi:hypothetical protein
MKTHPYLQPAILNAILNSTFYNYMADTTVILPKGQRLDLAVARKIASPSRSISSIAFQFSVPRSTLSHRLNGRLSVQQSHTLTQRLTAEEETSFVSWITRAIN